MVSRRETMADISEGWLHRRRNSPVSSPPNLTSHIRDSRNCSSHQTETRWRNPFQWANKLDFLPPREEGSSPLLRASSSLTSKTDLHASALPSTPTCPKANYCPNY